MERNGSEEERSEAEIHVAFVPRLIKKMSCRGAHGFFLFKKRGGGFGLR